MKLNHVANTYSCFLFILCPFLFAYSVAESTNFKNSYSNGYFLFGNPVPFRRHQLNSSSNISYEVESEEECLLGCINTSNCQSVNFKIAAGNDGRFLCYLLDTDKFTFPQLFNMSEDFHHYSFTVRSFINNLVLLLETKGTLSSQKYFWNYRKVEGQIVEFLVYEWLNYDKYILELVYIISFFHHHAKLFVINNRGATLALY